MGTLANTLRSMISMGEQKYGANDPPVLQLKEQLRANEYWTQRRHNEERKSSSLIVGGRKKLDSE